MCGIVGYVGPRKARPLLLAGLEQLEYRGYDSAGISVLNGDTIEAVRAVGNLSALRGAISASTAGGSVAVAERPQPGTGIGHTRWATHGGVTEENAHPHFDCKQDIVIAHNGIIENFKELKKKLKSHTFRSETDSEVLAHLIEHHYKGNLREAVTRALQHV